MRNLLLLLLVLSISSSAFGQLGTSPASTRWQQINTEHFKILFPAGFELEGQRMANILQQVHGPVSVSLGKAPRKIPLLLQNQGTISNGFVTWSPRRSEFYATPTQDYNLVGTNNWLNLLAVHEFRHIVQYEQVQNSRVKLAYYLFGQNGLAGTSNLAIPAWFWEGDAVVAETALTPSGRGRIPDFNLLLRTTLLERGPYGFYKQHLGSFKDNVPNHYVTGYHLITHVRRKTDRDVWGNIMHDALDNFYVPFTFSNAMRKHTGKRLIPTYRAMTRELDSLWRQQADRISPTEAKVVTNRKTKTYTDYLYPQPLSDGSFVAIKSGLSDINTFVRIKPDGSEEKIFTPGILNSSPMLSVVKDKIVWSEYEYDPRWETRNYSVIKTYDIAAKDYNVLTHQTRLSAPAFSPDAQNIAAIEVNPQNISSLVILDAISGSERKRVTADALDFLSMPRWSPDGRSIVLLRTRNQQRTITQVDVETGSLTDLIPYTSQNIAHPVLVGNYIYFNAPYTGTENIFALDLTTKKQYLVAARRYAAINPALTSDGSTILFNDFSVLGYNVAQMPNTTANYIPLENLDLQPVDYIAPLVAQENNPNIFATIPTQTYPVEKYSRLPNILNIHSWMPTIDPTENQVSLSLLSQDILSTTAASLGYTRNISEKSGRVYAAVSYQGLYPIINLTGSTGYRTVDTGEETQQWQEKTVGAGLVLPLVLTNNKYRESLSLSANTAITSITDYYRPRRFLSEQTDGVLRNNIYSINYTRALLTSRRDLAGRFEQRGFIYYNHTPFGGDYKGELFAASARLAFPGLVKNHSFQVRGNYQQEDIRSYVFSSPIAFPRGYDYRTHYKYTGGTVQYLLPLWYPDIALGPIVYFQRLKANIFYDFGKGEFRDTNPTYQSIGIEATTDFNLGRIRRVLFDAGVRMSYLPSTKKPIFELMIADFGL